VIFGWPFAHMERVHLIWAALAFVAVLAVLEVRSRDAMRQFLSPVMQRRLSARPSPGRIATRLALVLLALASAVIALMQPQARGGTVRITASETSADIVFVLDVSKSMLAEDTAPNRLARAKVEIAQMVDRLEGNRVGLVAFAGRGVALCPLTADRAFFELVLSGVDTSSVGKGGTRIGEAVRVALRSFPKGVGAKLIVLITDGEDHESYPLEAAKEAQAAGVHIVAVGLGSEEGSQITLTDRQTGAKTVLTHDGNPVISRLDGETLRKMALTTEGAYVPAGTAALDLDSILDAHVRPIVREAAVSSESMVHPERYPWFVLGCLVLLLAALWVGAGIDRPEGAR
jgi:Ca-activated chloride channel family protein